MKTFSFYIKTAVFLSLLLVVGFFHIHSSYAAGPNPFFAGTTFFVYGTSHPSDFTHQALINSYLPLGGYNATRVVYRDISSMSANQVRSQMIQDVAYNPSAGYVMGSVGHGDPSYLTSTGLTGPLNRIQMGDAINNAYAQNGVKGWLFEDSCGSGATCNLWKPNGDSSIQGVFTSTRPGVVGNDTNYGNGWTSDYGEAIKGMLNNAGKGGPNDADVNHDGVLTGKEVGDYLNKHNPGRYELQKGDENKPMFFKDAQTAAEKGRQTGSVTVATKYKVEEGLPVPKHLCNDLGFEGIKFVDQPIRKLDGTPLSEKKQCELAFNIAGGTQAVALGGVPLVGVGPYGVSPFCIENKGQGTPKEIGLLKAEEGAFSTTCEKPNEDKNITPPGEDGFGNQNSVAGDNTGSSGAMNGSGQTGGGLDALLAALMQGLFGGGRGGVGNQNHNPYGAGYQQPPQSCTTQGVSPVCGADGKTYNNPCFLAESGTVQVLEGICPIKSSPLPAPIQLGAVMNQLSNSGIPTTLLDTLRTTIAAMLSSILGGSQVGETVIK